MNWMLCRCDNLTTAAPLRIAESCVRLNGRSKKSLLLVSIEASGGEGSVKPFANMKLRGGLQAEVVGIVEVGLLHNDSHSVTGLIGKLGEIVGLKLCKGRESVFAV